MKLIECVPNFSEGRNKSKIDEIIGEALSVGIKLDDIESWNENLGKITLKMVKKELQEFQKNKNYITGSLKN